MTRVGASPKRKPGPVPDPNSSLTRKAEGCETQKPGREGKERGLPLPKKIYEALWRRSKANATKPETPSAREAARVNSGTNGVPPVSASAVELALADALALAEAEPPLTVTVPTIPRSSCGMQK
jgi:hypothetical protein